MLFVWSKSNLVVKVTAMREQQLGYSEDTTLDPVLYHSNLKNIVFTTTYEVLQSHSNIKNTQESDKSEDY